jgi:GNAT superfamily N-acetyltransferase
MIATTTLDRYGGLDCLHYTYPRYRTMLMNASPAGPIVAVKGLIGGKIGGLVLGVVDAERSAAEILSLYVASEFRGRGLARRLMEHIERGLRAHAVNQISLGYLEKQSNAIAMQRILSALGWEAPQPQRLVCCADRRIFTAKWMMRPPRLPDGFELFPWDELRTDEREALRASQASDQWIAPLADPFRCDGTLGFNSVGMRHGGAVVGWLVTHYFDNETLSYSCSYIRPDLQPRGYMIALYAEAIRRQAVRGLEFSKARWVVPYVFPTMIRFVRRWVEPYAILVEDFKTARKSVTASSALLDQAAKDHSPSIAM